MAAIYDWQTVSVNIPAGTTRSFFFGGNQRRVSLICGAIAAGNVSISDIAGSSLADVWGSFPITTSPVIHFRDLGPIMQGPIWASHQSSIATIVVITEIYLVRKC